MEPTEFNFKDVLGDPRAMSSSRNDYLTLHEGNNKMRILSPAVGISQHFMGKGKRPELCVSIDQGCPYHVDPLMAARAKWAMWVIDYEDQKVKIARLSYTIVRAIQGLQENPEYAFTSLPMPYDIIINAVNAGTKEVKYTITPARKNSDISEEILTDFASKKPINQYVQDLKDTIIKQRTAVNTDEINIDDISF